MLPVTEEEISFFFPLGVESQLSGGCFLLVPEQEPSGLPCLLEFYSMH